MKRLLPLLFALFCASAHAALVQHTSTRCASTTTCAVTLSGVASSDAIIIFPSGTATGGATVTDSNGTVSTARGWSVPSSVGAGVYYVANTASGTHTITLTTTSGNLELYAAEYSGLATAPFDLSSAIASGSGLSPASASITPAGNNELLVGFVVIAGSSVTFSSWGSSLVQVDTQAGGPSGAWAAFTQTTGTAGSASATASASGNWVAVAAFFKAAGACTHQGQTAAGALAVPNGSSGSYLLKNGSIGTPDCATVSYKQPTLGNFGVN